MSEQKRTLQLIGARRYVNLRIKEDAVIYKEKIHVDNELADHLLKQTRRDAAGNNIQIWVDITVDSSVNPEVITPNSSSGPRRRRRAAVT